MTPLFTAAQRGIDAHAFSAPYPLRGLRHLKMGEPTYYRRVLVKRLIEETGSFIQPAPVLRSHFSRPNFQRPEVLSLSGKAAVSDTLHLLIEEELSTEAPRIKAVLQPECEAAGRLASICTHLSPAFYGAYYLL